MEAASASSLQPALYWPSQAASGVGIWCIPLPRTLPQLDARPREHPKSQLCCVAPPAPRPCATCTDRFIVWPACDHRQDSAPGREKTVTELGRLDEYR